MKRALLSLCVGVLLLVPGCSVRRMMVGAQASATRDAADAFDNVAETQVARVAAANGLAQLEGMHKISPNNEDVLFMLARGWVSYGFAFAQEDMDNSEEGSDAYEENKGFAKHAYDRAVRYGLELLSHEDEGFPAAKRNESTLRAWLVKEFTDKKDAEALFWTGYAWLARVNLLQDRSEYLGELWVGVKLVERSYELDPDYNNSNALLALALYHARMKMAELDVAKKMFDELLVKSKREYLIVQYNYAKTYACLKGDRALYDSLIAEVLAFDIDKAPSVRLYNTIAKRGARKAVKKNALRACGFDPNQKSAAGKGNLEDGDVSMDDFMAKPAASAATSLTPTPPAPSAPPPPAPPASATPSAKTVPPPATAKPAPPKAPAPPQPKK